MKKWDYGFLPEVGDLQRSSEVLDPSLESQSAAGATEVVIKHGRTEPYSWTTL